MSKVLLFDIEYGGEREIDERDKVYITNQIRYPEDPDDTSERDFEILAYQAARVPRGTQYVFTSRQDARQSIKDYIRQSRDPRSGGGYFEMYASSSLRKAVLKLGAANPALRPHLGPLLRSHDLRVASMRAVRVKMADSHAVKELTLYIQKDRDLYRKQKASEENQRKHWLRGRWNEVGAAKGFMPLVDEAAKKFVREFGGDVRETFPKLSVRGPVAQHLAEEFKLMMEMEG